MCRETYRFRFDRAVPPAELAETLMLTRIAIEAIHGEVRTRLDVRHRLDAGRRVCDIDAGTAIGRTFARLLAGLCAREYGRDSFRVQRVAGRARTRGTARAL